jgi:hypothetical protein
MTQTSRALVALNTLEKVDSLILESNKSNASASFSGVRRESFSPSEQMTPRPIYLASRMPIEYNSSQSGEEFSFLVPAYQRQHLGS